MVGHTKFTGYHMDVTQRVLMPVQGLLTQTILVPSIETLLSTREVPRIPPWVRASWTTWGAHGGIAQAHHSSAFARNAYNVHI